MRKTQGKRGELFVSSTYLIVFLPIIFPIEVNFLIKEDDFADYGNLKQAKYVEVRVCMYWILASRTHMSMLSLG